MKVHVNGVETELGGRYIGAGLRDSNSLLNDGEALRERLATDGYFLIRGLLDREEVLAARQAVLQPLADKGVLAPEVPPIVGALAPDEARPLFTGDWKTPEVRQLTQGPAIAGMFERVLAGEVVTYDYKWLRVAGRGFHTGLHWDSIYWEKGEVYSAWIPLGDVPLELGPLALLSGAPEFAEEARNAPRKLDEAFDFWGTIDPFDIMERTGARLETTDFRAGDVVVFTMYTPHGTLKNQTERIRLSVDVRFQLTSEPLDMQYMGEDPSHQQVVRQSIGAVADRTDLIGRLS